MRIFLQVQSEFSVQRSTIFFLSDNHFKTLWTVKSEGFPCRMHGQLNPPPPPPPHLWWIQQLGSEAKKHEIYIASGHF